MTAVELILALIVILSAAIVFTNAVEMLGERLNLGSGAVGSVLAAVGTALPETMIPVIAIIGALFTGDSAGGEIGVGAILGAPFLLATLAMFIVGASALGFSGRRESGKTIQIDESVTERDLTFFLVLFTLAAVAGLISLPLFLKIALAVVLLGAYAFYVYQTIKSGGESQESPGNLWLWPSRFGTAPTWAVVTQLVLTIVVMGVGAHFFVSGVEHLSESLGIPAGLIALVLAPLATELPEKFNSIYWMRSNDDTLAFGNITGAMVFQSTIPVSLGILFTSWSFNFLDFLAVAIAIASGVMVLLLLLRKGPVRADLLMLGGIFYAVFVTVAVVSVL